MIALRTSESNDLFEIDTERELEAIHMILYENAEILKHWKNALEGTEVPDGQPCIPNALQDQVALSKIFCFAKKSVIDVLYYKFTSFLAPHLKQIIFSVEKH